MFARLFIHAILPVLALTNPLGDTSPSDEMHARDVESSNNHHARVNSGPLGWKAENAQITVPLTPKVRTGLMNPLTEEGLIVNRKPMTISHTSIHLPEAQWGLVS